MSEKKTLTCGEWQVSYFPNDFLSLSLSLAEKGGEFLEEWQRHFPREETFVWNNYGVPSLFVRLDGVTTELRDSQLSGNWLIFEVEERPAGLGLSSKINPPFKECLFRMKRLWPEFFALISPKRTGFDDFLWLGQDHVRIGGPEDLPSHSLVLVRAEPEEEEYHILEQRSISTLKTKGCKMYGERLGLWRKVSINDINWDIPFVLKPLQGSKTKGIYIWHPQRKKEHGCSTRSQILRAFQNSPTMYMQDWIEPFKRGDHYLILRVYYGWDPEEKRWKCLGGVWNSRPNLLVHGAKDSFFGPIIFSNP